jgi:hypothetical protein
MVHAQEFISTKNIEEAINMLGGRICTNNFNFIYDGSPNLNDEFVNGEIFHNNQWRYMDIPIRYNIFNDEIEYKPKDKERIYALKPDTLFNMIIIPEDTFIVSLHEKDKGIKPGFFKLLANGKAALLVKMEVEFKEAQSATTHKMAMPAKFLKKPDKYYVKKQGELPINVKNVKKLIEQLGNHQDELTTYAKKEKLSGKKEKELKQLIYYYNSL